jgi:hypothetical protein
MNINPVVNIPSNVTCILKYSLPLAAFLGLFFAGLKDAPVQIIMMLGLFFLAFELSFIPYDLGNAIEDEAHSYKYGVKVSIFSAFFILAPLSLLQAALTLLIPVEVRYYSQNGLRLAKFFKLIAVLVLYGMFLPLFF